MTLWSNFYLFGFPAHLLQLFFNIFKIRIVAESILSTVVISCAFVQKLRPCIYLALLYLYPVDSWTPIHRVNMRSKPHECRLSDVDKVDTGCICQNRKIGYY